MVPPRLEYNPVPVMHQVSHPMRQNCTGKTETDRNYDQRNKIELRNGDRKYRGLSSREDRKNKRTNEIEENMNGCKFSDHSGIDRMKKEVMEEDRRNNETKTSDSSSVYRLMMERKEGEMHGMERRKDKLRVEVRAVTDIRTGVMMGPYPEPFVLGVDLLDQPEDHTTPDHTIWVSTQYLFYHN